jgi:hypothetical protein
MLALGHWRRARRVRLPLARGGPRAPDADTAVHRLGDRSGRKRVEARSGSRQHRIAALAREVLEMFYLVPAIELGLGAETA